MSHLEPKHKWRISLNWRYSTSLAQKGVQRSEEIHEKMPYEEKNMIMSRDLDLPVAKLALV